MHKENGAKTIKVRVFQDLTKIAITPKTIVANAQPTFIKAAAKGRCLGATTSWKITKIWTREPGMKKPRRKRETM